ncbi:HU domain-containing protein [Chitinophaga agri]|uniref:HU domain-containing protein n=1 Tax=Chitinophaga agri TaxID=2703787 RepID=UPI0021D39273|nr:hypothetical protein [Chitinophaga agri]
MVLQQYIQEILFRQHICCLPQLGVFKLTHTPARYDVTSKTILPPGEIITFEETLTNDGGLLDWISQKEHLVPAVAQLKMEKYLEDLRKTLKTSQRLEIPGVGVLHANAVGRISFEQEPPALTRDVLHVSPVIRQDVSHKVTVGTKEMVNKQVVDHLTASPSSSSSAAAPSSSPAAAPAAVTPTVTTTPATPTSAGNDYEYDGYAQEIPSRLRWLWVAIPVACVVAAGVVWYSVNKNRPQITRAESAVNPTPPPVEQVPAASPATEGSVAQSAVAATPQTLKYAVAFSVYKTRKAAEKMYHTRRAWKQPVEVVARPDSTFLISEIFNTPAADTTQMKDSISKKYKPTMDVIILINPEIIPF